MLAKHQLIFAKTVHSAAGALQTEDQAALQLFLPLAQLRFSKTIGQDVPDDLHGHLQDFLRLLGSCTGIDGEQTGINISRMVGIDRIGQAAFFTDFLEQTGAHTTTDGVIQQNHGILPFILHGTAGKR
ncbi:hypothetical protein D3C73_1367070 [compost metagenome]